MVPVSHIEVRISQMTTTKKKVKEACENPHACLIRFLSRSFALMSDSVLRMPAINRTITELMN